MKRFHFDEDSLVDVNLKLNITGRTENSLKLSWDNVEHADGFNITSSAPIKEGPYPNSFQTFNVPNDRSVLQLMSMYYFILSKKLFFYLFYNLLIFSY